MPRSMSSLSLHTMTAAKDERKPWFQAPSPGRKLPAATVRISPVWGITPFKWPLKWIGNWKCWVYSQWNSHLIGIMISKTIGFRGLAYFQTHPNRKNELRIGVWGLPSIHGPTKKGFCKSPFCSGKSHGLWPNCCISLDGETKCSPKIEDVWRIWKLLEISHLISSAFSNDNTISPLCFTGTPPFRRHKKRVRRPKGGAQRARFGFVIRSGLGCPGSKPRFRPLQTEMTYKFTKKHLTTA